MNCRHAETCPNLTPETDWERQMRHDGLTALCESFTRSGRLEGAIVGTAAGLVAGFIAAWMLLP